MKRAVCFFALICIPLLAGDVQNLAQLPKGAVARALQLDSAGNLYVAGSLTVDPRDRESPIHAFVGKFNPDGSQRLWWRLLAGSGPEDDALALALGPDNSVYVTGTTYSRDFPTTTGAMQSSPGGPHGNAFAVKFDTNGTLLYSTYMPADSAQAVTVDSAGNAFVTGVLSFGQQPFTPTPGAVAGAANSYVFPVTGYILELDPTGSHTLLAILGFGGYGIVRDSQGNIYAAGAVDYQATVTPAAFQSSVKVNSCIVDAIELVFCDYQHIAKINPTGTQLIYATYLSGTLGATPSGMVLDSAGNVMLAGTTNSPDYPTTARAYQPEYFPGPLGSVIPHGAVAPPTSGYVTKLNADGTSVLWSTLFGGSNADSVAAMAVDANGNILIAGTANSSDLPGLWNTQVASRPVASSTGRLGFVARFSPDGSEISPTQLLDNSPVGALATRPDGTAVVAGSRIVDVSLSGTTGRVAFICDSADNARVVSVAPGQLLTLYGTNLARTTVSADPTSGFPTTLGGVTVTFNGIPAPLLYVSLFQINLQAPFEVAGQSEVTMQVSSQSVDPPVSESYILAVVPRQPSAFLSPTNYSELVFDRPVCNEKTLGGVQPLALNPDGSINTCANPARPGDTVTIFLNGMGVVSPAQATGVVVTSTSSILPEALLMLGSPPTALVTQTLAGSIAGLATVQIPAPTVSSVLDLAVGDPSGGYVQVRGPGFVIWVASGTGSRGEQTLRRYQR